MVFYAHTNGYTDVYISLPCAQLVDVSILHSRKDYKNVEKYATYIHAGIQTHSCLYTYMHYISCLRTSYACLRCMHVLYIMPKNFICMPQMHACIIYHALELHMHASDACMHYISCLRTSYACLRCMHAL